MLRAYSVGMRGVLIQFRQQEPYNKEEKGIGRGEGMGGHRLIKVGEGGEGRGGEGETCLLTAGGMTMGGMQR